MPSPGSPNRPTPSPDALPPLGFVLLAVIFRVAAVVALTGSDDSRCVRLVGQAVPAFASIHPGAVGRGLRFRLVVQQATDISVPALKRGRDLVQVLRDLLDVAVKLFFRESLRSLFQVLNHAIRARRGVLQIMNDRLEIARLLRLHHLVGSHLGFAHAANGDDNHLVAQEPLPLHLSDHLLGVAVLHLLQHIAHPVAQLDGFGLAEAAGGDGRSAHPQPRGDEG